MNFHYVFAVQLIFQFPKRSCHQKVFLKIAVQSNAVRRCSTLVIKKVEKDPMEEFIFSEYAGLKPKTLPNKELLHKYIFFNHKSRTLYYNGLGALS